jgi:hypothetical protein
VEAHRTCRTRARCGLRWAFWLGLRFPGYSLYEVIEWFQSISMSWFFCFGRVWLTSDWRSSSFWNAYI